MFIDFGSVERTEWRKIIVLELQKLYLVVAFHIVNDVVIDVLVVTRFVGLRILL